jgi:predicted MFS family arabinose efflux permease
MTHAAPTTGPSGSLSLVLRLGTAQTLAWASSYYLPAILAKPMALELGISTSMVFGALSAALVVSALLGKMAGAAIDRHGGRPVLAASNLLFATGLALLALANSPAMLFAAWIIIGVAMSGGLYDGAFAALVRINPTQARSAITGITLLAGFASTVGWPITAALETAFGWRETCLFWAAAHLGLGLPLNALLPKAAGGPARRTTPDATQVESRPGQTMATILLAAIFALTWFVTTALAAHLPRMLQDHGMTMGAAVLTASLVGPAQVAGRIIEFGFLQRFNPILVTKLATLAHPLGAGALLFFGAPAAMAFALLHGIGNGVLTIAKGVLPLTIFGPHGYGARLGLLMAPARMAQACAPLLFGMILDALGSKALWVTMGLGLLAFVGLVALKRSIRPTPSPDPLPATTA